MHRPLSHLYIELFPAPNSLFSFLFPQHAASQHNRHMELGRTSHSAVVLFHTFCIIVIHLTSRHITPSSQPVARASANTLLRGNHGTSTPQANTLHITQAIGPWTQCYFTLEVKPRLVKWLPRLAEHRNDLPAWSLIGWGVVGALAHRGRWFKLIHGVLTTGGTVDWATSPKSS